MGDALLVRIPDIGDFDDVEVVEILVSPGDSVNAEDSLVSIESDKATMEIPSPVAGVVQSVHVALGDHVAEGSPIVEIAPLEAAGDSASAPAPAAPAQADEPPNEPPAPAPTKAEAGGQASIDQPSEAPPREPPVPAHPDPSGQLPHASPLVRRYARELGVDLAGAAGSGPQGRVLTEDVKAYVRGALSGASPVARPSGPRQDPADFGPVHDEALGKVRRVSARNLAESWREIPHVTQHDEADVTELEAFRKSLRDQAEARGVKLSPLHFVIKAVAVALRDFPDLRSVLSESGESLAVRDYYHLGIAVDTDHGLVVPVLRDVDRKGIFELAEELAGLAEKARARKLAPGEMQGAAFTISSLGGIGGTAFTPIVNGPEVALLGLSRLSVAPRWTAGLDVTAEDGRFEPRVTLPLSLSYDHRVIDGAEAVRFTSHLVRMLSHPAHLLL